MPAENVHYWVSHVTGFKEHIALQSESKVRKEAKVKMKRCYCTYATPRKTIIFHWYMNKCKFGYKYFFVAFGYHLKAFYFDLANSNGGSLLCSNIVMADLSVSINSNQTFLFSYTFITVHVVCTIESKYTLFYQTGYSKGQPFLCDG
jgi:hypothetical protein